MTLKEKGSWMVQRLVDLPVNDVPGNDEQRNERLAMDQPWLLEIPR
jgi:hypothetical protein